MQNQSEPRDPPRREFLKEACSIAFGTATVLVPAAAGLAVVCDPLRKQGSATAAKVLVTTLDALPEDGVPRKFAVISNRVDAWNKFPSAPIGAVYLRRMPGGKVEALNVVCPHAGCFVDFRGAQKDYYCPCHNSSFDMSGQIADKKSPAPRGMDTLEVEIRHEKEVWVAFQNFLRGHAEKIPVV